MITAFRFVAFVFAASLTITRLNALDLTPERGFRELEGVKIPVVFFNDGKHRFQWQPPSAWKISGGGTSLLLTIPGESSTGMELRIIPRKVAEAPDGKTNPQAATEWIKPFLPALAQNQTFIQEIPSPFLIEGVNTRELTYIYTYLARDFTTSVALVNLDSEYSLAVIIYAPSKEFDRIHEEGTKSMFRWTLLKASTQRNPTEAGETRRTSSEQK